MRSMRYGSRISACDRSLALTSRAATKSPHPGSPPCSLTRTGRTSRVTSVRIRRLKPRSPCSASYSPVARMCTPFVGRVRGPERPDGVPPSWVAGRTSRNQVVPICLLTKEWWSRTSLVRVTSVSTLCAAATSVDSWPVISTERVGCSMRWPISTPLPRLGFLSRSSDHAQAKGRTPGHSFPGRYRPLRLDAWECTSSGRQWSSGPSSISRVTTACSPPRTSFRRDPSEI